MLYDVRTNGQTLVHDFAADFRILFTSNWGRTGTEEVEMFMIQLPSDWPNRLP